MEHPLETAKEDHLYLNGADLVELSIKYGTPLFVFDEKRLRENYRRFRDAFSRNYPKTIVCYSVKTNYNLLLCKRMQEEGAYAEVASGLDLHVARKAGFTPDHLVFDGLFKPETALREAIANGVLLINAESFTELANINKIAGMMGKKQKVGIRVNNIRTKRLSSEAIYCNPLTRFGFSPEEAYKAFKTAEKFENLDIKGIMTHPYWGIHQFLPFVKRIQDELGIQMEYINFGGGFEKSSTKIGLPDLIKDMARQTIGLETRLDAGKKKEPRAIEKTGELVAAEVRETLGNDEATLIFEPGRYIIHDAGLLLLRVGVIKEAGGFKWLVVDGGTNLNSDWLERKKIIVANKASAPAAETVNVVGPLLFARDFVTIKKTLPKVEEGDTLAVFNSGAYTLSNSTQFLNPRPCAVLVDENGKATVARRRETYDYVLAMDEN